MQKFKTILKWIAAGVVLFAVIRVGRQGATDAVETTSSTPQPAPTSKDNFFFGAANLPDKVDSRDNALKTILRKWGEQSKSIQENGILTELHVELARETVTSLGLSHDMMALLDYLNDHSLVGFSYLIDKEIENLLKSEENESARLALVKLVPAPGMENGPANLDGFLESWTYLAGCGCNPADFLNFAELLANEKYVASAKLGQNVRLVTENPELAFTNVLQLLEQYPNLSESSKVIRSLQENMPQGVNFEALLKAISIDPEKTTRSETAEMGRKALLQKWTDVDPSSAAIYTMQNPDGNSNADLATVIQRASSKDPRKALDLAQSIPDGPGFDVAVHAVIPYISDGYPDESKLLAAQITDAKLREESLNVILGKEARKKRRSKH
jgi:hypothetical protein